MRIHEIISRNNDNDLAVHHRADPRLDIPPYRFDSDLSKVASAFTKDGVVKSFWYLDGSEDQPSEPAPLTAAGTELMPSDHLEPAMTSWEPDPAREEPYTAMALTQPNRPASVAMRAR
jgi:hypothetical protein